MSSVSRFVGFLLAGVAAAGGSGLEVTSSGGRNGPCSATLTDGRSFITGGGEAPLATARYFERGGSLVPAAPMSEARWSHICAGLPGGTVLVAGGFGPSGRPVNSAEIFHPDSGQWTPAGPMLSPRTGATAILMADGRVLIIGGLVDGQLTAALEIYDPSRERFEPVAGDLSAPRKGYAVAALEDGRILIAGGAGPDGAVMDNTDLFDPRTTRVLPGARMIKPRTNLSATRLLDGRILLAGGSSGTAELASTEILDPATGEFSPGAPLAAARQGHLSLLIPENGRVLIEGGLAGGKSVAGAEFFIPWRGVFEPAQPGAANTGAKLITVGRLDAAGRLLSANTYASPTIVCTGRADPAGEAVTVKGAGWQPGEEVKLSQPGLAETTATAGPDGRFTVALTAPGPFIVARGSAGDAGARRLSPDTVRTLAR